MSENLYRSITKGTSLFGGTQLFNILISILRGKLVAMFLGPDGMGFSSLLTSATTTIQHFTSLGLNLSIVKEIASHKDDINKTQKVIYIARTLLYITAFLGALGCIIFSSQLSYITFGNYDYKYHFTFLSVMVFFTTLSNGELSILQGLQALKKIVYSSFIGSICGFFVVIPLYYFYSYNGVVPALIIMSLITYLFYRYYNIKLLTNTKNHYKWGELRTIAFSMLSLGIIMMCSSILGSLCNYGLNTFIRYFGGLDDVGFFQSVNSITNQCVGPIFTAMGLDYFPRLSAVASDNLKVREIVNIQSEIVILIITPIAIALILFAPLIVNILLTEKFISIIPVIRLFGLGILFKGISYPLGYISFSKGDKKIFFYLEGIFSNFFTLFLNCMMFYLYGIIGLGISFALSYIIYYLIIKIIAQKKYSFIYNNELRKIVLFSIIIVALSYSCSHIDNNLISNLIITTLMSLSLIYSIKELDKRISIYKLITNKLFKKNN